MERLCVWVMVHGKAERLVFGEVDVCGEVVWVMECMERLCVCVMGCMERLRGWCVERLVYGEVGVWSANVCGR